jgi:hypothetical protein
VITSTAFNSRGVRITITDLGLGMTWDEINEANQRIGSPPATEVVGSQRLGFYVVGRLSRRLDAAVELKPGRAQGTVVTIDLPPALFVSGTVVESLPAADPSERDAIEAAGPDDADAAQQPAPAGDEPARSSTPSGLPTRGGGAAPVAPSPSVPAPAAPGDGGLPRRSSSAPTSSVAPAADPAPVAEAPAAPRAGMFSSFRSRRAVESEVEAVAQPEPTSLEALANDLPEFVPTIDTATPALPHRSEVATSPALPQRGASDEQSSDEVASDTIADDEASTEADVTAEVATVDEVASPVDGDVTPVEPVIPGLVDDSPADAAVEASVTELPSRALSPLDEGWQPEPESVDVPADQPLVALLADEPDPVAAVPGLADEPVALATDEVEDVPVESAEQLTAALAEVDDVRAGSQARSTLSELAREHHSDVPDDSTAEQAGTDELSGPSQDAPVAPVPAVPVTPIGAPAMDILPSRSGGRGLRLRRTSRPKASRPSPVPQRHAEAPVPTPARSSYPVASAPAPVAPAAPDVPAEPAASAPTFAAPAPQAAPAQPMPAPSSLFTPPPAPVDEPAATPTPAFPPASVPALVAAQSLRERSAMASEALSELSALSTYRPESVTTSAQPASLVRRTPQATPAAQLAEPQEPQGPRRANRNAADVRSMLSGFRAGVERGRTSPGAPGSARPPEPGDEA